MGSGGKQPAVALLSASLVCVIVGSFLPLWFCRQDLILIMCSLRTHNAHTFIKVFIL